MQKVVLLKKNEDTDETKIFIQGEFTLHILSPVTISDHLGKILKTKHEASSHDGDTETKQGKSHCLI